MTHSQAIPEEKPDRTRVQWSIPILLVLFLVVGPWVVAIVFGADRAAVPSVVIMALAPLVLGFIDGRNFRLSWTFIVLAVVGNFIASELFYNNGVLIYTIGVGLLAWLGSKVGEASSANSAKTAPKAV